MSFRWSDATWPELDALGEVPLVAILPIGAIEAHGPHLPLATDNLIAEAMADDGARRLALRGVTARVLPTVAYTAAPFASGFRGSVSVSPETVSSLIVDIGRALTAQRLEILAIANAHLDPANLGSIRSAVKSLREETALRVIFPDVTRKPWALRLSAEFKSGACHAGRYEGSVVLAVAPGLVDEDRRRDLPENPVSLSAAISAGKGSFEEIGGEQAYFGDPAAATAEEGRETIAVLGEILAEAVAEELGC